MDERTLKAAVKAARKKIRVLSDKKLNENLSFACGSLAEAYCVGVEEAQMEILDRLLVLAEKRPNPKRGSPPFPEAEAAGGGGNSPDVSNAHSAGAS